MSQWLRHQSLADVACKQHRALRFWRAARSASSFPERRAIEPQARAAYESFGLNERQIELHRAGDAQARLLPQSRRGNRLFDLALGAHRARLLRRLGFPPRSGVIDLL
jgi:type IV secretion system protein VirB4